MPLEAPDFGGLTPEQITQFEQWEEEGKRRQLMPWEGERFVSEVEKHKRITEAKDIKIPEIEEDILDGLAYQMGRLVERTGYYLEPEGLGINEIYDLIGVFCTVEQGRKRPRTQITTAIEHAALTNIDRINKGEINGWEDKEVDIFTIFGVDREDPNSVKAFTETDEYRMYDKEVERWMRKYNARRSELTPVAEGEILKKVVKLKLREMHRKFMARESISKADLQRLLTADNADSTVDMILRGKDPWWQDVETPDALAWPSAFSGEFGEKVDEVLREIERMGREGFSYVNEEGKTEKLEDPYAKLSEFSSEHQFTAWIKQLYEKSGERMDIVLFAWQLARVWGITDELGHTTKKKTMEVYDHSTDESLGEREVEVHQIGDSPLVTDHSTWAMHTLAKLASEYGLTAFDQKDDVDPELAKKFPFLTCYRTTTDRHISHSGAPYHYHPEALASLHPSYLKWAKVPVKKSELTNVYCKEKGIADREGTEKVALYDLWTGKATGQEVPLANLPWSSTAMTEVQADEPLPKASFGLWQLYKNRTLTVVKKLLRGIPDLKELLSPRWWEDSQFRHLKKVARVEDDVESEENPRARLLLDWLLTRKPPIGHTMGGILDYHYQDPKELWLGGITDQSENSVDIILNNAWNVGFISKADWDWIKDNLGRTMVLGQRKDPVEFYRRK